MREFFAGSLDQGEAEQLIVLFLDNLSDPVLGLTSADVTFKYMRQGDIALNAYPLSVSNFFEISDGLYRIILDAAITSYVGTLKIFLSGPLFDDFLMRYDVIAGVPGNVQVTINIEDGVAVPLPETQVDIWNSAQTLLLWSGVSDINGQIVTALNPGSYKVLLRRNRTSFTVPETLSVVGPGAESETYVGTELSLISPTVPDTCIIYGDIFDIDGVADDQMSPDAIIIRAIRSKTPVYLGTRLLTIDPVEVRADQSGHFEITLIRGMSVNLEIPRLMWRKTFTVPNQASENIINLL